MANPNDAHVEAGEGYVRQYMAEMAARYLPNVDPDEAAAILIDEPDHPMHGDLVALLDEQITAASAGHSPGITAEERAAAGGSSWLPDYRLGPGDQQLYGALRDSNLLNAVIGRMPVKSAQDLTEANYLKIDGREVPARDAGGESPWGATTPEQQEYARRYSLAQAGHDYHTAQGMPQQHSTFFGGSPYPQHTTVGEPHTLPNTFENNGDGALGQALGTFTAFVDASKRAARQPPSETPQPPAYPGIDTTARAVARWGANMVNEVPKAFDEQWAHGATNRASPLVPRGVTDPELRADSIKNLAHEVSKASTPEVKQYGESRGVGYAPITMWGMDLSHEFADPITFGLGPAKGAWAVGRGVLKNGGKGLLRGLMTQVPLAAGREVAEEGLSPMNYGFGALTLPKMDASAFKGYEVTPEQREKAAGAMREQKAATDSALGNIGELRGYY